RLYGAGVSAFALPTDYALSEAYLAGRGDRSYFDIRSFYFYGFSPLDSQGQIPIVHPVIDHDYTFDQSWFGGDSRLRTNPPRLHRQSAAFEPINATAVNNGLCTITSADPTARTMNNCVLPGVPGDYTRASNEASWRRTIIDPWGQVFTPFASLRTDLATVNV